MDEDVECIVLIVRRALKNPTLGRETLRRCSGRLGGEDLERAVRAEPGKGRGAQRRTGARPTRWLCRTRTVGPALRIPCATRLQTANAAAGHPTRRAGGS